MRKTLTTVLALVLAFACITSASAAAITQDSMQNATSNVHFELKNDPTYTITIPDTIAMAKDGSTVSFEASNVADLDGKKISITIAGTNYYRNQMVLERAVTSGPRDSMRYQIITEDGTVIESNAATGADPVGQEITSFTGNGVGTATVKPVVVSTNKPGMFEGSITFGISLLDA